MWIFILEVLLIPNGFKTMALIKFLCKILRFQTLTIGTHMVWMQPYFQATKAIGAIGTKQKVLIMEKSGHC